MKLSLWCCRDVPFSASNNEVDFKRQGLYAENIYPLPVPLLYCQDIIFWSILSAKNHCTCQLLYWFSNRIFPIQNLLANNKSTHSIYKFLLHVAMQVMVTKRKLKIFSWLLDLGFACGGREIQTNKQTIFFMENVSSIFFKRKKQKAIMRMEKSFMLCAMPVYHISFKCVSGQPGCQQVAHQTEQEWISCLAYWLWSQAGVSAQLWPQAGSWRGRRESTPKAEEPAAKLLLQGKLQERGAMMTVL